MGKISIKNCFIISGLILRNALKLLCINVKIQNILENEISGSPLLVVNEYIVTSFAIYMYAV